MARYAKNVAAPAAMPNVAAPSLPTGDDVKRFAEHARKLVDDEVSLRFGRSASELNRLAEVLRTASARLDGSFTAPYFEGVANQIDRAAGALKNANTRDMVEAVQRFARTNPLVFLGGVLALGIGAGRFLKSSALPALPSGSSAPTAARPTARKQKQRSFSNTRDES
jgi:hypothetical protein